MNKPNSAAVLWAVAPILGVLSSAAHAAPTSAPAVKSPASATMTKAPVAVAASVNNDKFLRADLERAMTAIKAGNSSLQTGTQAAKLALSDLRQSQIDNWVNSRLLLQEAARRRIVAAPADMNKLMKAFRASFLTTAEYQAFLKSGNQSEAGLRKIYSERLVLDELSKRLAADVTVSNTDIQKTYEAWPSELASEIPNQARARHILLLVPTKASEAERDKIRAQALDILKKAQAPDADFGALVKQYSQDPGAKESGNSDSGEFSQEEAAKPMKPFADAVFAAKTGQILGPIKTDFGFHIIRVEEESHKPKLSEDLKNTIRALLVKAQVRQKLDAIIAQNRKTSIIKTNA